MRNILETAPLLEIKRYDKKAQFMAVFSIEWIDSSQKTSDKTIADKFNNYRFADYKEYVISLFFQRVDIISVETLKIIAEMAYNSMLIVVKIAIRSTYTPSVQVFGFQIGQVFKTVVGWVSWHESLKKCHYL